MISFDISNQFTRQISQLNSHQQQCMFCQQSVKQFSNIIQTALFYKYSSSQNFYFVNQIEDLIEQETTVAVANFHEYLVLDDDEEYLKREYKTAEFPKKIQNLSQYYKFHKDLPRFFKPPIENTMNRYYDNKRQFEYKKIKKILKEQQNIQIGEDNQQSESLNNYSSYIKKSRYSTILGQLKESMSKKQLSESKAFLQIYNMLSNIIKGRSTKILFDKKINESKNDGKKFQKWLKKQQLHKKSKKQKRKQSKQPNYTNIRHISRTDYSNTQKNFKKKKNKQSPNQKQKRFQKKVQNAHENFKHRRQSSQKFTQKQKNIIYNTNVNIEIKNALFYQGNKFAPTKALLNTLQINKKTGMQNLNSFKNFNIKPLIKNLELLNGVKVRSNNFEKQKSIEKIYGIQSKSKESLRKNNKTFDSKEQKVARSKIETRNRTKSSQKISLQTTNNHNFRKTTISTKRSKQKQKERSKSNKKVKNVSLMKTKSKSVPLIKIGHLQKLLNFQNQLHSSKISKNSKGNKQHNGFSSVKTDHKEKIQKILQKKLQLYPSNIQNRIKSVV